MARTKVNGRAPSPLISAGMKFATATIHTKTRPATPGRAVSHDTERASVARSERARGTPTDAMLVIARPNAVPHPRSAQSSVWHRNREVAQESHRLAHLRRAVGLGRRLAVSPERNL